MWHTNIRKICLKTRVLRVSKNAHKKAGYFLLECIIGLMLVTIVMGYTFTISVGLSRECKQINESIGALYGLSSICDAFEEDMRHAGPLKMVKSTGQEIVMHTAFDTIAWNLSPTGLRRICKRSDNSDKRAPSAGPLLGKGESERSKLGHNTFVSRDIASMSLNCMRDGYEFELRDTKGNHVKRYIEVIT